MNCSWCSETALYLGAGKRACKNHKPDLQLLLLRERRHQDAISGEIDHKLTDVDRYLRNQRRLYGVMVR